MQKVLFTNVWKNLITFYHKHTLAHQKAIGKHVTATTLNPLKAWNIPNITKRCLLCLHEKLAIITFKDQDNLLNKRSKLRHENKFLLSNYKSNDWFYYQGNKIWFEDSYIVMELFHCSIVYLRIVCNNYMKLWVVNYCYTFS